MFKKPKASITCEMYENGVDMVSVNGSIKDLISMLIAAIECAAEKNPTFVSIALTCINGYFKAKRKSS